MRKVSMMVIILSFVFLMISCVTTKAVRLGDSIAGPRIPWRQIKVYRTAAQVKSDYEEVALLMATGDSMWTNEKEMWNSLKKKAAKMGANAIILDATSEPSAATKVFGWFLFGVGGQRKGKALAIYIHPEK